MKYLKLYFFILLSVFLISCKSSQIIDSNDEKIVTMKSYTSDAVIKVHGNKSSTIYKVKQTLKSPSSIKVETIEPKELSGKKTVFKNGEYSIHHPAIGKTVKFNNIDKTNENMCTGIIKKEFFESKDLKKSTVSKNNKKCIEYKASLKNPSDNRSYGKLYVDEKSFIPILFEIYDENDKVVVEISYFNFKYNPTIDDKEFILN